MLEFSQTLLEITLAQRRLAGIVAREPGERSSLLPGGPKPIIICPICFVTTNAAYRLSC